MKDQSNRLLELDVLRGIAALLVVGYHFTTRYQFKYNPSLDLPFSFKYGYLGVELFFVISGFVIFMTLEKTKKPMDFVVSRFARLYPAYFTVIILNVLLLNVDSIRHYLFNLTMISKLFGVPFIDDSFWTLKVELFFYIVMLVFFITKQLKNIEALGLAWLSVMMLYARISPLLGYSLPDVVLKIGMLDYGHLFFAGIIFYKIKHEGATPVRHISILLCLITQFAVRSEYYPTPLAVALCFLIFYLFCFDKLRFLRKEWLVFFGLISYSLYLIHQSLGLKILSLNGPYLLKLVIAVIASIAVATLITFFIEKPAIKIIRGR